MQEKFPGSEAKATRLGLTAVLMWSTIATAFTLALREVSIITIIFYASLIAFISLGIILKMQGKLREAFQLVAKSWLSSALLGFLNPFLYYLILLEAYTLLPAQEALVLNYLWPVSLTLLSIPLLKQSLKPAGFFYLLISFAGVIVIATRGDLLNFKLSNWQGDLMAIVSSFVWAFYWLMNARDTREEAPKLLLNFLFGAFYAFIWGITRGDLSFPEWNGWASILWIGLFELGITFYFWMRALSLSSSTAKIAQLVYLSPFLSLIFIHLILGESIYASTFVGLLLILLGILLNKYRN